MKCGNNELKHIRIKIWPMKQEDRTRNIYVAPVPSPCLSFADGKKVTVEMIMVGFAVFINGLEHGDMMIVQKKNRMPNLILGILAGG